MTVIIRTSAVSALIDTVFSYANFANEIHQESRLNWNGLRSTSILHLKTKTVQCNEPQQKARDVLLLVNIIITFGITTVCNKCA